MTVDEYETIRLIDMEGFTQEACASQMMVSRTTVQGIYNAARGKLARSIVDGLTLEIVGGEYQLCDGGSEACSGRGCHQHRHGRNL